jgi:hypothetical protein
MLCDICWELDITPEEGARVKLVPVDRHAT